jgi:putative protease
MLSKKPELLSPCGDLECLYAAVEYGADAVYLGGRNFGMRAAAQNFDAESMLKAVQIAHEKNVKVYVTCNIIPTNDEIDAFPAFLDRIVQSKADAVIVSDLGVLSLVKKYAPNMEIHISTQVGVMNYAAANELHRLGAKRVVLARETSLEEIRIIREKTSNELEIEAFVHGAMCVSVSGRCLLSAYMTGRDANRGVCAQSCRWSYALVEEKRPGEFYEIGETQDGSYILNARDLCMIQYLDALYEAGIDSFKIEGRGKAMYYVATVTNAYRAALDAVIQGDPIPQWAKEEVNAVSHRPYSTGFYFGSENAKQHYETAGYIRDYDFVGLTDGYEEGKLFLTQRNYFKKGETLEILSPQSKPIPIFVQDIYTLDQQSREVANHPMEKLWIPFETEIPPFSILRRKVN